MEPGGVMCLICGLWPVTRRDFDGLCLSCRASVADGLYRIEWVSGECGRRRIVTFVTVADHPLGTEFPYHADPIPYEPELLRELFAANERLEFLTAWG
jgi:Ni,Fe-hydrogenase III large subunit